MILAHPIVGVILGNYFGHFWYFAIGSVLPDIDHLIVLASQKIFSPKEIINSLCFEKKYNLIFKTKYVHSLFGAIILSLPVAMFDVKGGLAFFIGYVIHLLLDWPDIDDKYFFYPLRKKFLPFSSINI